MIPHQYQEANKSLQALPPLRMPNGLQTLGDAVEHVQYHGHSRNHSASSSRLNDLSAATSPVTTESPGRSSKMDIRAVLED